MLDNVEGPVYHVAYERGQDVIIMKGYKFAKAKTAAAAMLGCLALANPATAAQLFQVTTPSSLHALQFLPIFMYCMAAACSYCIADSSWG